MSGKSQVVSMHSSEFERLAFISLGFGRGAQVGKTSLLEVEFISRRKRRRWAYSLFHLVRFRPWDPTKTPRSFEEDAAFFYNAKRR